MSLDWTEAQLDHADLARQRIDTSEWTPGTHVYNSGRTCTLRLHRELRNR